jgi:N-acetylneuraminate synthase
LHCCSSYPAPIEQVNLKAIETIRKATNLSVGWSDHTAEPSVIYRAVNTWDASVIEFHLDIEGYGEEFESGHCWLPKDIESVIQNINNGKKADGEGVKEPVDSELPDRLWRADPGDGLRPFISIRKTFNKNDEQ